MPPGLAKRDQLPPGLDKREELPPGLAKRDPSTGPQPTGGQQGHTGQQGKGTKTMTMDGNKVVVETETDKVLSIQRQP